MSSDPSPPSPDALKETTEKLASFAQWIAELIQRRNWFTLLLLLNVAWFFFGNPGVFGSAYKLIMNQDLPSNYLGIFLLILGLIFVAALTVAVITMPRPVQLDVSEAKRHSAIKGLRAFEAEDAEVFAKLQRNQSLQACLESIARRDFRFGILVGESGCGKTSLLQAGLLPPLSQADSEIRGVYIKFSDRPPLPTIHTNVVEQLQLPKDQVNQADLLTLLTIAVETVQKPIVLLFDQFEQFFVHHPRQDDRQEFIRALAGWYSSDNLPTVKILVSIRADLQYELNQLQQALGYTLSRYEIFQLEKLDAQEATEVLRVLADTEKLRFDSRFVQALTQEELASSAGKVSPVDLQILAEVVRKQKTPEQRAFSQEAFQKLGGIDGLLNRYLEETLQTLRVQGHTVLYQTTIQVLLALTDRERNVRAGALTVDTLKNTLTGIATAKDITIAVEWLASSEVRLITPVEQNHSLGYELAHERIIPALLRLAGKELKDVDRANQLLERRVNEWVGNQHHPRYLLSWQELWLVQRHRQQLTWGNNRRLKEQLLKRSWLRWQQRLGVGAIVLGLLLIGWLLSLTSPVQQWQLRYQLATRSRTVTYDNRIKAATAFAMNADWKQAESITRSMNSAPSKTAQALTQLAMVANILQSSEQARVQLKQAQVIAEKILSSKEKPLILLEIARVYIKLNNPKVAKIILDQALSIAEKIQERGYKNWVLGDIITTYAKLNDSNATNLGLQQALSIAEKTQEDYNKESILSSITAAYAKLNDPKVANLGLQRAFSIAEKIEDITSKSRTLNEIAAAYAKLSDSNISRTIVEQALNIIKTVQEDGKKVYILSSIAATYVKLGDSDIAKGILEQTLSITEKDQDVISKSWMIDSITNVYAQLNTASITKIGLQQVQANAEKIQDNEAKSKALNTIVAAYAKLNIADVTQPGLQQIQAKAEKIQDDYAKSYTLSAIANAYIKLNALDTAKTILEQAQTSAEKVQDPERKSSVLSSIVQSQCKISSLYLKRNQPENARTMIGEVSSSIGTPARYMDYSDRIFALANLAQVYIELEDWQQANRTIALCSSEECEVAVASQALATWGEIQHPALKQLKQQDIEEDG